MITDIVYTSCLLQYLQQQESVVELDNPLEVSGKSFLSHVPVSGECSTSHTAIDSTSTEAERENSATFEKILRISIIHLSKLSLPLITIHRHKRASFVKNNVNGIMVVKFA